MFHAADRDWFEAGTTANPGMSSVIPTTIEYRTRKGSNCNDIPTLGKLFIDLGRGLVRCCDTEKYPS